MRALDLFCGAGGASMGLHQAGFEVVGIDLEKQRNYPFTFVQADAMDLAIEVSAFDLIWASPPCQAYSRAGNVNADRSRYPDLLGPCRDMLLATKKPFIIENVPGAPMRADVVLYGANFELPIIRERWFECEGFVPPLVLRQEWAGKTVSNGDLASVAGRGANNAWNVRRKATRRNPAVKVKWRDLPEDVRRKLSARNCAKGWQEAMGVDWMNRDEIRNAVPPAYAKFLGEAVAAELKAAA